MAKVVVKFRTRLNIWVVKTKGIIVCRGTRAECEAHAAGIEGAVITVLEPKVMPAPAAEPAPAPKPVKKAAPAKKVTLSDQFGTKVKIKDPALAAA